MMISKSYRSSLLRNSSLIRHFSTKEVLHSLSAKKEILKGVNLLVNTIQSTLGPRGRNIVIDIFYSEPKITKDGLSVAKSIDFSNKYHTLFNITLHRFEENNKEIYFIFNIDISKNLKNMNDKDYIEFFNKLDKEFKSLFNDINKRSYVYISGFERIIKISIVK